MTLATFSDRVYFTTSTAGTGNITVGAAMLGFRTPAEAGLTTELVSYAIEDGSSAYEVGRGTMSSAGTIMARVPIVSSAGGAAIALSGSARVLLTAIKDDLDEIVAHSARTDNPHTVTKAQIGLANITDSASSTRLVLADNIMTVSGAAQAAFNICNANLSGTLNVSGGTGATNGGSVILYGSTHASNPNRVSIRSGASAFIVVDATTGVDFPQASTTSLTPTAGDSSTKVATTAFVTNAVAKAKQALVVACSDETTALTAGTAKVTYRMPYALTLTAVRASLTTAQTSGTLVTVDINEGGVSILGTKLTIDNTEKTSTTAAAAATITDAALADDAEITIDVDSVGDGTAKGLKMMLIGTLT